MVAKKFNHKKYCVDHVKVDGYLSKVCILKGQEPEPIISFAKVMSVIARTFGYTIPKPGVKKRGSMHHACGGHFAHPIAGEVCYGRNTGWTKYDAIVFLRSIEQSVASNPLEHWRRYWVNG